MNLFLSFMWIKDLTSCQKTQILFFLEQIFQCNILPKAIFETILNKNL